MKLFKPDAWTGTHIFGSFFLACLLQHFMSPIAAAGYALLLGFCWEIIVDIVKFDPFNLHPDPRGGDWGDIIADAVGCALSIWI